MAKKIQVTRPTKIELARLKRRLKLATRIQKIVKDRLSILIMEFLETVRECASAKEELLNQFNEAYRNLSLATGFHGHAVIRKEESITPPSFNLRGGSRNIAGVRVPLLEFEIGDSADLERAPQLSRFPLVDYTIEQARICLAEIVRLAELEKTLELLGLEINKVKRINNALEYFIIPALNETIQYLSMKFEEREREEVTRLKRVKRLIEEREAHAY